MMNSTNTPIRIRDLHVRRGRRLVLPGVSLDIRGGAVTGLLGPSGSGKSTLLRSIVGVQIVESGEVCVHGLPAGSTDLRRRIGYVTQAPSVYDDLTVRENLRYFGRILGVENERGEDVLEIVGLRSRGDQIVGTLDMVKARGVAMPPGQHRVSVEREGYFPFDTIVDAKEGEKVLRLEAKLVPVPD